MTTPPPTTPAILLVEDEAHLAFTLEFNLSAEGYAVRVASTLRDARALLAQHTFDLILLDVMLPDGSGIDLCAERRTQGDHTPLIMLTAKSRSDDIVAGLNAGADDYVTKPFKLRELLSRIHARLRRSDWQAPTPPASSTPSPSNRLHFNGHVIDFDTHQALLDGADTIDLTELELRLIRFFATHEGRAISRQELLEKVWRVSPDAHTRTVDNFIVRLRRTFEANPAHPRHFLTVRGVGYRFVLDPDA